MAKRNAEFTALQDVIKEYVTHNKRIKKGLEKISAEQAWEKVMGAPIMKYTTRVWFERDTLYVQLNSSVLREELSYGVSKIIEMLQAEMQNDSIQKIRLQ